MFGKWLPEILVHSWPLPSQVCCAGLVAHMGPKMLTVHYPGMRPREDNKQQNVQNGALCSCRKARGSKKA